VLAVAPHSSFLDMLVLPETQLATVVSRSENQKIPVIGGECWGNWEWDTCACVRACVRTHTHTVG
jgi:hypothetical protein